jgi:hypothetical protein
MKFVSVTCQAVFELRHITRHKPVLFIITIIPTSNTELKY